MGIINTSPESFYKKSIKLNEEDIQNTVLEMQKSGVDILDIGGMSTAPYLETFIPIDLEIERLQTAISSIRQISDIPISIDSVRSKVIQSLLKYEINAINDITGLKYDKKMAQISSKFELPVILGAFATNSSEYSSLNGGIYDIIELLSESIKIAKYSNIHPDKLIIDPSIGFFRKQGSGTLFSKINGMDWYVHDIDVLSNIKLLNTLDKPVCISVSGKSFIGSLLNLNTDDRLIPSIVAEVFCITKGVSLIRTHNVKETRLALQMLDILC